MPQPYEALSYQGLPIEFHAATGLICLTDLWQAQCAPTSQRPLAWVRLEATQKLLKRLAQQTGIEPLYSERQRQGQEPEQLIVALPDLLETTEAEGNLRTYATTELAVVYARYLGNECYEWALVNLAEGDLAEQWARQQTRVETKAERKALSRRAVIAAGWAIPVVTTLALSQRAAAQVSAGHTDTAHGDTAHSDAAHTDHGDVAHADGAHGDTPHTDTAHGDAPHADTAHADAAHADTAHADTAHADTAHADVAMPGLHNDIPGTPGHVDGVILIPGFPHTDFTGPPIHTDTPHTDTAHTDAAHTDAAHTDTAHADAHTDTAHGDLVHSDGTHGDSAHVDS